MLHCTSRLFESVATLRRSSKAILFPTEPCVAYKPVNLLLVPLKLEASFHPNKSLASKFELQTSSNVAMMMGQGLHVGIAWFQTGATGLAMSAEIIRVYQEITRK